MTGHHFVISAGSVLSRKLTMNPLQANESAKKHSTKANVFKLRFRTPKFVPLINASDVPFVSFPTARQMKGNL
jgi:hypothetical protein